MSCPHDNVILVRLDTGPGGIQYRKYCTRCWCATSQAIPHAAAHEEEARRGYPAPLADLEILRQARNRAWRPA